jgi:hypothetical protein
MSSLFIQFSTISLMIVSSAADTIAAIAVAADGAPYCKDSAKRNAGSSMYMGLITSKQASGRAGLRDCWCVLPCEVVITQPLPAARREERRVAPWLSYK